MNFRCFGIEKIPDLTLSKYSFLDEGGVEGVLKKTGVFLRQMNRKGLLSKVYCHLLYSYDPKAHAGNRMKVFFITSAKEEKNLKHTQELVEKSTLSAFYIFEYLKDKKPIELVKNRPTHSYAVMLVKHVFPVEPSIIRPDDQNLKFQRLVEWKMNETARLYNLFKLMQGLSEPCAFRVDLFPIDYTERLQTILQEHRSKTNIRSSSGAPGVTFQRDENAEETLRQYETITKSYESTPHFLANIFTFADDFDIATLLADAAGAEALEKGNYEIKAVKTDNGKDGPHSVLDYMDIPKYVIEQQKVLGNCAFLPSLFMLEEIRPFFTFPALYDGEAIEIPKETAPEFAKIDLQEDDDEMSEEIEENKVSIYLGRDENRHPVSFKAKSLKRHAFIAGVPGSGKTNTMLHLATSLWITHQVPFLILEPAKKEYRALSRIMGMEDLLIFSPSSGSKFPLHINPFEFPAGMRLAEHIQNLMAVFEGAFQLVGPAPFLVDSAIEAVYREKGWHPHTVNPNCGGNSQLVYPTLQEFYQKISTQVDAAGYEGETKSNVKSFIEVRLGSLLRREMGDLFDVSISTLPPEEWLTRPILIELEAMGSGPANFLTLLLCTLIREVLKVAPREDEKYREKPRHVIFLEEAHNLIGPVAEEATGEQADPKLAATAYIVKMLAEVRALHEGIVIADQLPTKMAPEVIKNTVLKIGHQLTAEDDRNLMGGTMSASATQLEQMATYGVGEALIANEKLLRPYKAKISKWQKDNANFEPPLDEELSEILSGRKKRVPPKPDYKPPADKKLAVETNKLAKPIYDYNYQLKRSMEIHYTKFADEQNKLLGEKDKVIQGYIKLSSDIQAAGLPVVLPPHLMDKKKELDKRFTDLLPSLANLFYKGTGYLEQLQQINKPNFSSLIKSIQDIWNELYKNAKILHPESAEKYEKDNEEIMNFLQF